MCYYHCFFTLKSHLRYKNTEVSPRVALLTQILKHNYIFKHYFDQSRVRRNIGIFKFILMNDFNE